jgi:hypothetical protein
MFGILVVATLLDICCRAKEVLDVVFWLSVAVGLVHHSGSGC